MSTQKSPDISNYRVKKIESYFKFLDANNDGFITKEDHELAVKNMARLSNASPEELEDMERTIPYWWALYSGGAGNITEVPISEVVQRAIAFCTSSDLTEAQEKTRSTCRRVFDLVDHNKDGVISLEEHHIHYKSYGAQDDDVITDIFKKLDTDRDGVISREEFVEAHVAFWFSDDPQNGCEFLYDVSK